MVMFSVQLLGSGVGMRTCVHLRKLLIKGFQRYYVTSGCLIVSEDHNREAGLRPYCTMESCTSQAEVGSHVLSIQAYPANDENWGSHCGLYDCKQYEKKIANESALT
jgi:hypothetical protein